MHALATEGKSLEILLIEDNPGDVLLMIEGIRHCKIPSHVSIVRDGEEAIDFLYQRGRHTGAPGPDIILINFDLPGKSGWEVLAEMELDETCRQIPVVVLTSSEADRDTFMKYRLRVNCFLAKPFQVAEFISVIRLFEQYWLSRGGLPASHRLAREKAGQNQG